MPLPLPRSQPGLRHATRHSAGPAARGPAGTAGTDHERRQHSTGGTFPSQGFTSGCRSGTIQEAPAVYVGSF